MKEKGSTPPPRKMQAKNPLRLLNPKLQLNSPMRSYKTPRLLKMLPRGRQPGELQGAGPGKAEVVASESSESL